MKRTPAVVGANVAFWLRLLKNSDLSQPFVSAFGRSGHFWFRRGRGGFVFLAIGFGFFGVDHTVIGIGGGMAASFTRRLRF